MQYQIKKLPRTFVLAILLIFSPQSLFADEIFDKVCTHAIHIGKQVAVYAGTVLIVHISLNKGLPIICYYLSPAERARVQQEQQKKELEIAYNDVRLCLLADNLALRTPEQEKKHRAAALLLRKNLAQCEANFESSALNRYNFTAQSEELQPA